jgi:hypothetical protein
MESFLQITDFEPYLNTRMLISWSSDYILPAELIELEKLSSETNIDRTPFSIVFRTEQKNEYFKQGNCILQHPEKGDINLFLVPLGLDEKGMRYEAIFS